MKKINRSNPMRVLWMALLMAVAVQAHANDGVYYTSGNLLVPMQENNIAVTKEILTIDIGDDGYAKVDVYYELFNRGQAKTVDMGFEAAVPYNSGDGFSPKGIHPYIKDFTVTMNSTTLPCRNAVVAASGEDKITDFTALDLRKWHLVDPENFNEGVSTITDGQKTLDVAYAYCFKARFEAGKNVVHHTHRYKMSSGVNRAFQVPYWLTPATRWANHQVDDFTLRIKATNTAKHFTIDDDVFRRTPFKVTEGRGKVRTATCSYGHYTEVTLRNGTVECHINNFKPTTDMCIQSAENLLFSEDKYVLGCFYDRGNLHYPAFTVDYQKFYGKPAKNEEEENALIRRIITNLPYADRGYVFHDANLKRFFESQWWYMPDPNWQMSTQDFKDADWYYINKLGKNYGITDDF